MRLSHDQAEKKLSSGRIDKMRQEQAVETKGLEQVEKQTLNPMIFPLCSLFMESNYTFLYTNWNAVSGQKKKV